MAKTFKCGSCGEIYDDKMSSENDVSVCLNCNPARAKKKSKKKAKKITRFFICGSDACNNLCDTKGNTMEELQEIVEEHGGTIEEYSFTKEQWEMYDLGMADACGWTVIQEVKQGKDGMYMSDGVSHG